MRPAVFLDRDGVLMEDAGYVNNPGQVRLLPGVVDALRRLRVAGFLLVVATNQSGVARGCFTEEMLAAIHRRLLDELERQGAPLDGVRYCPHLPGAAIAAYDVECGCRKPAPGLLREAAEELDIDLTASFLVGDSERDVLAGQAAGCRTILLHGPGPRPGPATLADALAEDLVAATDAILAWS